MGLFQRHEIKSHFYPSNLSWYESVEMGYRLNPCDFSCHFAMLVTGFFFISILIIKNENMESFKPDLDYPCRNLKIHV